MDPSKLPEDFVVTSHQFTRTVYRDQYPSIDPSSPELSQAGKVVIVTGASRGLGRRVSHNCSFPETQALFRNDLSLCCPASA